MFQLQAASTDVSNGNLAVAWCVDAETLKYLSDKGIKEPQVVITTAPVGAYHVRREYRKVVPLKDLMAYIEFKSSGENKIFAFIADKVLVTSVHDQYLLRGDGEYRSSILLSDGSDYYAAYQRELLFADPVTVNVPNGAFAKEPPQWEKDWVNFWFRQKPQDQCEYRRRRLLAYTVQPIAFALMLILRAVMFIVASLWLSNGLSFKYLLHPIQYNMTDTLELFLGGSWTIEELPEDNDASTDLTFSYIFRKFWKVPLMPLSLFVMWLVYQFNMAVLIGCIVLAIVIVSTLVLTFASGLFGKIIDKLASYLPPFGKGDKEDQFWYMDPEEIRSIICSPNMKKRTSVKSLPAKHRTLRLRIQDLKSKVCRPFSA